MPRAALANGDEESPVLPKVPRERGDDVDAERREARAHAVMRLAAFRILRNIASEIGSSIAAVLDGEGRRVPIGFDSGATRHLPEETLIGALKQAKDSLEAFIGDERFAYPGGYEARLCGVSILGAVECFYRQMKSAGGHDAMVRDYPETQEAAVQLRSSMLSAAIRLEALERGYVPQEGLIG